MTAGIVHSSNASEILIENLPALLFEYLPGKVQQRPEYELNKICHALADIHRVQQETPLELEGIFTFDATCIIWLSEFNKYSANTELGSGIAAIFENLKLIYETQCNGDFRGRLYGRSINIHNHGDVSPKNVILGEDGEAYFFDFNNAFFGSRMADILDGAFEFSLAENYSNLVDFARFDVFISLYEERNPLTQEERDDLPSWIELIGLIKFLKEIRMLIQRPESRSRTKRLHAIADFVLSRRMSR
jgi:Ser/Thr protein kinase RdoA (MazF antagonist)